MKLLPIGISDFKALIEDNYYYVDKTLLIEELLSTAGQTILIPRPRRFGKTLNLSMLKYFFENTPENNSHLFADTAIWSNPAFQKHLGKYPVIFLTFKDVKMDSWEGVYRQIVSIIAAEYKRHFETVRDQLDQYDLQIYTEIREERAEQNKYSNSLFFLSELLHKKYNAKVIILIDEYDAPIHTAYNNGFYDTVISFIRLLLSAAFKDNPNLARGVLTGILRTAKEGIFSGLNNLEIPTILNESFQDKFGFTHDEVKKLLDDQNLSDKQQDVQEWYNGYIFGNTIIYNPWSIISCVKNKGDLKKYWSNTSDNKLIRKIIALADETVKAKLELLFEHKEVIEKIDEGIIFPGIEKNAEAVWSLLLFTGYLTSAKTELKMGSTYCALKIPNEEVYILFREFIQEIFAQSLTGNKTQLLFNALKTGDSETFEELLQEFIFNSMSYYDLNEPEKSYHIFILGILVNLTDDYMVQSNRESELGRYDNMIIPRNKEQLGIVIEFKKVSAKRKETLESAAQNAISQIVEKNYAREMRHMGVKNIIGFGIACKGKEILVRSMEKLPT